MSINVQVPSARLDHLVINVRDGLDAAEARYRQLGFRLTPRGHHSLGSSNHLAVFGSNYLELLGFPPGQGHRRPELLEHPLGLSGLAFRADDAGLDHARLQTGGVEVSPVRHFSRPVSGTPGAPDVDAEVRFSTFQTFIEPPLPGRVFYCQHHTPERVWQDAAPDHPNGACDIAALIVATPDPERSAAAFAPLAGPATRGGAHGIGVDIGNATVSFLTADALRQRWGIALDSHRTALPHMAAIVLKTSSLDATARFFRHGHLAFNITPAGALRLDPAVACGVTLLFTP